MGKTEAISSTTTGKIEAISKIHRPESGDEVPLVIFRAFRHFTADYVTKMLGRGASVVF